MANFDEIFGNLFAGNGNIGSTIPIVSNLNKFWKSDSVQYMIYLSQVKQNYKVYRNKNGEHKVEVK